MTPEMWATFALGAFFGAGVTVLVWALCATAARTDRHMEQEEGNE